MKMHSSTALLPDFDLTFRPCPVCLQGSGCEAYQTSSSSTYCPYLTDPPTDSHAAGASGVTSTGELGAYIVAANPDSSIPDSGSNWSQLDLNSHRGVN